MANIIQWKRKTTTGAPLISQLAIGEACINTVDNVLHIRKDMSTMYSIPLGGTAGDMLKSTYDTTNNGKVDLAENSEALGGSAAANYALKTYVDDAINALVNGAGSALNTLQELAAALGNDANFATTVTNSLATKLDANSTIDGGTIS